MAACSGLCDISIHEEGYMVVSLLDWFLPALAPLGMGCNRGDHHGWEAIFGIGQEQLEFLLFPEVFFISLGVALWITAFDVNYALMDKEAREEQGIKSFPAAFGSIATRNLAFFLAIGWVICFYCWDA